MTTSIGREIDQIEDVRDAAIHWSTIYVAPALVLPEDLMSFASCHDLTYLQPVQRLDGDSILVHAAPLAHRLSIESYGPMARATGVGAAPGCKARKTVRSRSR
jgi:hypothetical protein